MALAALGNAKRDALITVRVPQTLKDRAQALADQAEGDTLADVVNVLLESAVDREERRRARQAEKAAS
jgi:antitoxin component of RelBE/YafQ-DinJ toxin-antitoxin module